MGDDGFIVSDKTRFDIFRGLMTGETNLERLVKKNRLIRPAALRAVRELEEHKLVQRDGDARLVLTDRGREVSRDLKRQDALR